MSRFGLAVLALVVGQSLFLAAMVWDRAFGWYRDYAPPHLPKKPSSNQLAAEASKAKVP